LGVDLLEFPLPVGDDVAVFAKKNGTRTGGSLIERENIRHGAPYDAEILPSLQCLQIYRVPGTVSSKNHGQLISSSNG
jgi:hypothetical protein